MRKVLMMGATSAIAQATAKLFAAEGDQLFLVARNEDKLKILAEDLKTRGSKKIELEVVDANKFDRHADLIKKATDSMGGLDTVLIAYGTLPNQEACEKDYAQMEKEIRTNLLSILSLLTIIANQFEEQKKGSIAVISSVAGDRGRQSNYVYGAAKGALSLFLQGLRNRLQPAGVSVVTIKPGFVDTPMTAHMKKGLLFVGPEVIAKGIYQAIEKKKDVVYLPWFWVIIMAVIKAIPEFIFKKLKL